ncbi:MAG: SGNH/GDSL hydrolase family protein [Anaerolineae bacterium]|nr:SGNH/GDSL hydrolase family protein [Anaerolineae bacterium]
MDSRRERINLLVRACQLGGGLLLVLLVGCLPAEPTEAPTTTPLRPILIITDAPPTATATPFPTSIPTLTRTPTPLITTAPLPTDIPTSIPELTILSGYVGEGNGGLRLRQLPGQDSVILLSLQQLMRLTIYGRSADNNWVRVETNEGFTGWVAAAYLVIEGDLNLVPVITNPEPEPLIAIEAPVTSSAISGITSKSREIFVRGQSLGNRPNVFSKVGDSLTVGTYFLFPYSWGTFNLRDYGYLYPVLQYFSGATARDNTSFGNTSLAADNGWTSASVLDPARANPGICQPGESPLVCEYRVVKPAVALILFGTNDVSAMSAADFAANLARIVEISIDMGVIPVLSTIPNRGGFEGQVVEFNQVVMNTARAYDIPLWDYGSAMNALPNGGLSSDMVHPSWPPGDFSAATDLTAENLQYGYTLRNLMALQVLDALWRQVLY